MSKIESGKMQFNAQSFDINALIIEVVADNLSLDQGHNIVFTGNAIIYINADKEKIVQVLNNLISNAVKYSVKGSTVTVATFIKGKNLKVSVKDQGIGLKLKDQQAIFQRFYRVDNESTRGSSGFGIGLYLSAEIIKLHHGKIGVESQEGKGSEFYFLLPLPVQ
jgi:signal transduction histidine kinase